jgi:hypothetical protein
MLDSIAESDPRLAYVLLAMARGVITATTSPMPVSLYSGSTQMTATFN